MRRPVITVLAVAAGIVLLLLLAAAIAIWSVDVNTLAAPIRERVKASTGRDLSIGGGISLKLSLEPRIEMRDVTLSNAPWASGGNLVTAKRLDAQLALLPLIRRQFDIRQISLSEPTILLETDKSGRGNWELSSAKAESAARTPSDGAQAASAIIGIGNVEIDRGTVEYRNGKTGAVTRIVIDHLDLHTKNLDTPVNATFKGAVDGVPVALTGNAGPLSALIDQHWPYPLNVEGQLADHGTKLDAKLAVDQSGPRLDEVHWRYGETTFTGSIALRGDRLVVSLSSPRVNVSDLALPAAATAAAANALPPSPASAPSSKPSAAGAFFSSRPLPLGALRSANVDADLAIGDLVLASGRQWKNVRVHVTAADGRVDAPVVEADAFGGRLRATIDIDARSDSAQLRLTLAGDELDLGALLASAGASTPVRGGKTQVRAELTSRGASAHDWARHANGAFSANVGPASIDKPAGKESAMAELLGTLLPIASVGNATEIHCAVVRLPVRDGVARADRSIGVETDKIGLLGSGTIDLGNETVDLSVRPSVAGGGKFDLGQLAGLVHWRGPWRSASITIDPLSAAGTAASVTTLLAGGTIALGPIAGVLVPKIASQLAPQAGACTIARGSHR
ncbi:MAG TPA: AsmA family protein [Casimicrobiaceae bacterium]|nr:AsmA family protein [Casimicrobiaceae bacterium]